MMTPGVVTSCMVIQNAVIHVLYWIPVLMSQILIVIISTRLYRILLVIGPTGLSVHTGLRWGL